MSDKCGMKLIATVWIPPDAKLVEIKHNCPECTSAAIYQLSGGVWSGMTLCTSCGYRNLDAPEGAVCEEVTP